MTQALVRKAFEARLATWAATRVPSLLVAWPNVAFTPPAADVTYLQAFLLPARTTSDTLGGEHRHFRGVFQVSVVGPIGVGPGEAEGIAAELDALFPPTAPLLSGGLKVYILQPMSIGGAVPDDEHYVAPVSCTYRADSVS